MLSGRSKEDEMRSDEGCLYRCQRAVVPRDLFGFRSLAALLQEPWFTRNLREKRREEHTVFIKLIRPLRGLFGEDDFPFFVCFSF